MGAGVMGGGIDTQLIDDKTKPSGEHLMRT